MANSIADLEALPEIDFLEDEGITLEGIQEEMITDYQKKYFELTGDEMTLYPANPRRLEMNVIAGEIYQAYEYMSYLFRQNFIRYMEDDVLWNWGANLGFAGTNLRAAKCTLEFGVNEELEFAVTIPAGTRATAGDDVFFAIKEDAIIPAGELSVSVFAECTTMGIVGNNYASGQINIMADPVVNIAYVKNLDSSSGGGNEYSGDELREKVFLFPSTYSVAGPEDAYVYYTKLYSSDIISVNAVTDKEDATVEIYIMLAGGRVPDTAFCNKVLDYLTSMKKFPDTDKVSVFPPEVVNFELKAVYYIPSSSRDTEKTIRESVEEAAAAFVSNQYESLGFDINPDIFTEYARVAGAKRVEITTPAYQPLTANQIAICSSVSLEYGGLEDD